jgi:integrase
MVALSSVTVAALREHEVRQNERRLKLGPLWSDQGVVFPNDVGGYINPHNLDRRFVDLTKAAGLPRIKLHALRHTHASLLLEQGQNVKVVSERLGHSGIAITLSTYAHTFPGMHEKVAEAFDGVLTQAFVGRS